MGERWAARHFGYQKDGSYRPCPECFMLPDGDCAAGGHGLFDIPPYEPGSPYYVAKTDLPA